MADRPNLIPTGKSGKDMTHEVKAPENKTAQNEVWAETPGSSRELED